jgi:hypothetical protein
VDGTGLLEVDLLNLSLVIIDYSSPIVNQDGQLWWDSIGGNLYVAYQEAWVEAFVGTSSGSPSTNNNVVIINDIAPAIQQNGQLWWNTIDGNLYVSYQGVWTEAVAGPFGSNNTQNAFTSTTSTLAIHNSTTATSTTTGALVVSGGVGIGGDLYVEGTVYSATERLTDAIFSSNEVSTNGTTATVTLDSYNLSQFRSAKYVIQIDAGTGTTAVFEVMEILLIVDNNQQVFATEYGMVKTHNRPQDLGAVSADCTDNIVTLIFTPNSAEIMGISLVRNALVV